MDKQDYVIIGRDPYARHDVVRRLVDDPVDPGCSWCDRRRSSGRLFQYGISRDANPEPVYSFGDYCSKACHDEYRGHFNC